MQKRWSWAAAVVLVAAGTAGAGDQPTLASRNYDARDSYNKGFEASPRSSAGEALSAVAAEGADAGDLSITWHPATGALRTLSNPVGYLTPGPGASFTGSEGALPTALAFVNSHLDLLGLDAADVAGYEITDQVYSAPTGATHLYLRQVHAGIPVYNGQLQVNINREGRIISVNNLFMPNAAKAANATTPALTLSAAVVKAGQHLGVASVAPVVGSDAKVSAPELSTRPITGRLMYLPVRTGVMRLVWNFQVATLDRAHWYDLTVDAASGKVWTRFDWIASDSYKAYALPAESPNHVAPLPPADGRTVISNPADGTASPFGWHDTSGTAGAEFTTTQGNNAHAYTDTNNDNAPDAGSSPDGGAGLAFSFAANLNNAPSTYKPAAVTNLFYLNNMIHDIQYQYGFDEVGGNFQENNYGKGGTASDYVQAEAQDGGGTDNANFATPPDGSNPRMQMYLWVDQSPNRDGDFDAGIVVHEYGHGISNRLVGGPANTSCLGNNQQPGEGTSDWWALVYTAQPGDTAIQARGIGTYALFEPTTGAGIRAQPYSTDQTVNTWTYASINGMAIPHGVGSVWAQAAWEVYWSLVNQWGWDADLYNAAGNAGNQRAMLYVNEGLKNTVCSPAFTDVRDGIIQAAVDNHGGEDVCRIWVAFAGFGLGNNAVSGGSGSTTPTNGFNLPPACSSLPLLTVADKGVSEGDTANVSAGLKLTLTPAAASNVTVSYATASGTALSGTDFVAKSGTLTFTPGQTTKTVSVQVKPDLLDEANENASLNLSAISGGSALISDFQGRLTINDNDPLPNITIANKVLAEGTTSTKTMSFTVSLSAPSGRTVKVDYATADGTAQCCAVVNTNTQNGGAVTINDNSTASPYPSTVTVPTLAGSVTKVVVKINGLSHTFPSDVDMLLVGPTGKNVVLLSDAGGGTAASGANLVFDDAAAGSVVNPIVSGTFKPTNIAGGGDSWPSPGPGGASNTLLSTFNGVDPAGQWQLLVMDTAAVDQGTIGSWNLLITTAAGDYASKSGTLSIAPGLTTKSFGVVLTPDAVVEANETFNINLSNAVNGNITDALGVGTIQNDD